MGFRNSKRPKLKIPYYPGNDDDMGHYEINSIEEKRIMDYAGLSIKEVWNLDFILYRVLLRDAVIFNNMQTESGREYLENCWRMEQTKPQKSKLRERFKKEGE